MIHSFSHRTDGPAFYWEWFLQRLAQGYCQVRNPYYPDKVSTYDLTPEKCDGFTFTSKNYAPVLDGGDRKRKLMELVDTYPTMWAVTITPYRKDVEPRVPSNADAVMFTKELSRFVGRDRLTWMYSPIAIQDDVYTWQYHCDAFAWLCKELAAYVSRVTIDSLRVYEKVSRNAPNLREPHHWETEAMVRSFAEVAEHEGVELHACPAHGGWAGWPIDLSACMTLERFGSVNGVEMKDIAFKQGSGLFAGCVADCAPVKDLAPYNCCPAGCTYCYANLEPRLFASPMNVSSPFLLDESRENDIVSHAKQRMYRRFV